MSSVWTGIAILFWIGVGAAVGIGAMGVMMAGRDSDEPDYAPYSWMLGKPCWFNEYGDYRKYRVVAVTHKGAVNIRDWDDETAKAFWVNKEKVMKGWLRFGENPYDDLEVRP